MRVLRELDAYVRNTFISVPATLAAWHSASRVERRTPRPRAGEQPAPPNSPTPDTPAPPPAG